MTRMTCGSTKTSFVQMHLEKSSTQKIDGKNHHLGDKRNKHSGSDVITEESFACF